MRAGRSSSVQTNVGLSICKKSSSTDASRAAADPQSTGPKRARSGTANSQGRLRSAMLPAQRSAPFRIEGMPPPRIGAIQPGR